MTARSSDSCCQQLPSELCTVILYMPRIDYYYNSHLIIIVVNAGDARGLLRTAAPSDGCVLQLYFLTSYKSGRITLDSEMTAERSYCDDRCVELLTALTTAMVVEM